MKNKKEFPKFKTLAEEAEYWEKHSIADYWQQLEDVEVEFSSEGQDYLVIQVGEESLKTLSKVAKKKKESIQQLAQHWIESLQQV